MLRSLLLAVTTYSLVACIAVSTGEALFVILPERQDSRITATKVDHSVVLDVYSESGIGGATVRWIGGDYPDHIRLRLHLHGLEELRLAYGATVLILSIASNDASVVRQYRMVGAPGARAEQEILPGSAYWMETAIIADKVDGQTTIPLEDGWVEVGMPQHFLAHPSVEFSLRWVDFFR